MPNYGISLQRTGRPCDENVNKTSGLSFTNWNCRLEGCATPFRGWQLGFGRKGRRLLAQPLFLGIKIYEISVLNSVTCKLCCSGVFGHVEESPGVSKGSACGLRKSQKRVTDLSRFACINMCFDTDLRDAREIGQADSFRIRRDPTRSCRKRYWSLQLPRSGLIGSWPPEAESNSSGLSEVDMPQLPGTIPRYSPIFP
jgi:hypothetical protein